MNNAAVLVAVYGVLCFAIGSFASAKPATTARTCFGSVDDAILFIEQEEHRGAIIWDWRLVALLGFALLALGVGRLRERLAAKGHIILVLDEFDQGAATIEQALLRGVANIKICAANALSAELASLRPDAICLVGVSCASAEKVLKARGRFLRVVSTQANLISPNAGPLLLVNRHDAVQSTVDMIRSFSHAWMELENSRD